MERRIAVRTASMDMRSCPVDSICYGGWLLDPSATTTLDLSGLGFVSISQACAMAQFVRGKAAAGITAPVTKPQASAEQYLSRMNFNRVSGFAEDERFDRHNPNGRFVPLREVREFHETLPAANELRGVISSCVEGVHKSVTGTLHFAFAELMDNSLNHSKSPTPAIVGAQYYPRSGFVEICVADSGVGIAKTLASNPLYSHYAEHELVSLAFDEGIGEFVGRPDYSGDGASSGRGLYVTARIVSALGGALWLFSGNSRCAVMDGSITSAPGYGFPGTLVVARLPVNPEMRVIGSSVYPDFRDSPIDWEVDEGGFYYPEDVENVPLW